MNAGMLARSSAKAVEQPWRQGRQAPPACHRPAWDWPARGPPPHLDGHEVPQQCGAGGLEGARVRRVGKQALARLPRVGAAAGWGQVGAGVGTPAAQRSGAQQAGGAAASRVAPPPPRSPNLPGRAGQRVELVVPVLVKGVVGAGHAPQQAVVQHVGGLCGGQGTGGRSRRGQSGAGCRRDAGWQLLFSGHLHCSFAAWSQAAPRPPQPVTPCSPASPATS